MFEVDAFDLKLQNYYFQIMDSATCAKAIEQNFVFADKIYKTGLLLEQYEQSNELTDQIVLEKKRYVLLKIELWLNSILLKNKCNSSFHTVTYIYAHKSDMTKDAEQTAVSDVLKQVKEDYGNKIILIPIGGDMGLDSVDMLLQIYNITYLPSVLIDEKYVLSGFYDKKEIEQYLK